MPGSWVLILTADERARPPAIVGGYPSQEAAERAGDAALAFDPYGQLPEFRTYTVIPGHASTGKTGSSHCKVWFEHVCPNGETDFWNCERHFYRTHDKPEPDEVQTRVFIKCSCGLTHSWQAWIDCPNALTPTPHVYNFRQVPNDFSLQIEGGDK